MGLGHLQKQALDETGLQDLLPSISTHAFPWGPGMGMRWVVATQQNTQLLPKLHVIGQPECSFLESNCKDKTILLLL